MVSSLFVSQHLVEHWGLLSAPPVLCTHDGVSAVSTVSEEQGGSGEKDAVIEVRLVVVEVVVAMVEVVVMVVKMVLLSLVMIVVGMIVMVMDMVLVKM